MRTLFSTQPITGTLIRAFEGGPSSHCGCVTLDGQSVIDASMQHGVRAWTLDEWVSHPGRVLTGDYTYSASDETAADDWLHEQQGKGYDWLAILGFVLFRDLADSSRWTCSELAFGRDLAAGLTISDDGRRRGVRLLQHTAHARAQALLT